MDCGSTNAMHMVIVRGSGGPPYDVGEANAKAAMARTLGIEIFGVAIGNANANGKFLKVCEEEIYSRLCLKAQSGSGFTYCNP